METHPIPTHEGNPDMPSATNDDHDGRYFTEAEHGDSTISPTFGTLTITDPDQNYLLSDTNRDGVALALSSVTAASDFRLMLFGAAGDGSKNVLLDIFGTGTVDSNTNRENLQIGFLTGTDAFVVRTLESGTGDPKSLILSADASLNQMILLANGNITVQNTLTADMLIADSVKGIAVQVGDEDSSNPAVLTFITSDGSQTLQWDDAGKFAFDDNVDVTGTLDVDGDVDFDADLDVDTGTLFVNSTTHKVGFGTLTPDDLLHLKTTDAFMITLDRTGNVNVDTKFHMGVTFTAQNDDLMFLGRDTETGDLIITDDGVVGVNTKIPATQFQVVGDVRFGDQATNYAQISATGDVSFAGTAGFIYGHMDVPAAAVITVDTSGDANPVEVADDGTTSAGDGWESDYVNGTTFAVSDLHYITVNVAGTYEVIWNMSIKTNAGPGTVIHGGITVDTTTFQRDNGEDHAHVFNNNDDISIGGVGVVDCPNGNEEISLWISNDAAQKTVVEHGNMRIKMIGGT